MERLSYLRRGCCFGGKVGRLILFLVLLIDGSSVNVSVADVTVEMQTEHGVLKVPFRDIISIDFAFRNAADGSLVRDLGDKDYKVREKAQIALIKLGAAAKAILRTEIADKEGETRRKRILAQLENVPWPREVDTIVTAGNVYNGKIIDSEFVGSSILGSVKLKIGELVRLGKKVVTSIKISCDRQWHGSVLVKQGESVRIKATGQINFWQGTHVSGPEGHSEGFGRLIARIRGEEYSVGEGTTITASQEGELQFYIVPPTWTQSFVGNYEVEIR